jgi:hypothetical protein
MMSISMPRVSDPSNLAARALFAIALLVGVSGCSDKAKPKYDECIALEAKWETVKARDACKAASEIAPNSKSGKLAAGKLSYLNEQANKILAEKSKKEAPCKTGKWVTHCKWKDKPRPNLLEAATFARCNTEADEVRIVGMVCPVCECSDRFVDPYKDQPSGE